MKNQIPVEKLFKRMVVSKTNKSNATRQVKSRLAPDDEPASDTHIQPPLSSMATDSYQVIAHLKKNEPVVRAKQIMTSPVICLNNEMSISDALHLFSQHTYRHMPILSLHGKLAGIVSDRDILHYISGLSDTFKQQTPIHTLKPITDIMSSPVLTASIDTDIRYIAQLFVLQHIGAIPIMEEGHLQGMITRTDILSTVMNNYDLELWI